MYQKEIKVEPPFAKQRFWLILRYDKLLHISLSFMLLAFLYRFVGVWLAFGIIAMLWVVKEVIDWLCGDEIDAIAGDLLADVVGGLAFAIWYYFG